MQRRTRIKRRIIAFRRRYSYGPATQRREERILVRDYERRQNFEIKMRKLYGR